MGHPSWASNYGDTRLVNHQLSAFLPMPLHVHCRLVPQWYNSGYLIRKWSENLDHQRSYMYLNLRHCIWNFQCGNFFAFGQASNLDGPLVYQFLHIVFQSFTGFRAIDTIFATNVVLWDQTTPQQFFMYYQHWCFYFLNLSNQLLADRSLNKTNRRAPICWHGIVFNIL